MLRRIFGIRFEYEEETFTYSNYFLEDPRKVIALGCVAVYEDVIALWDKIIEEYLEKKD